MLLVYGRIGIRRNIHPYAHRRLGRLHDHEACAEQWLVVGIVVIDGYLIVSGEFDARNGKLIVGVVARSEDGLPNIINDVVGGEAIYKVAFEKLTVRCPVGIARFYPVGVAMVFVRHVVEADINASSQHSNRE